MMTEFYEETHTFPLSGPPCQGNIQWFSWNFSKTCYSIGIISSSSWFTKNFWVHVLLAINHLYHLYLLKSTSIHDWQKGSVSLAELSNWTQQFLCVPSLSLTSNAMQLAFFLRKLLIIQLQLIVNFQWNKTGVLKITSIFQLKSWVALALLDIARQWICCGS